nr:hypothetical protein [uncultured bacterium]
MTIKGKMFPAIPGIQVNPGKIHGYSF